MLLFFVELFFLHQLLLVFFLENGCVLFESVNVVNEFVNLLVQSLHDWSHLIIKSVFSFVVNASDILLELVCEGFKHCSLDSVELFVEHHGLVVHLVKLLLDLVKFTCLQRPMSFVLLVTLVLLGFL